MGNRAAKTQVKADQPRLRHYEIPPEECLLGELPDEICIRIFKQLNMRELIWLQSCCLSTILLQLFNVANCVSLQDLPS